MQPLTHAHEASEAPQTLLDALARAPAAAALVVAALDQLEDRKALRLAHPQLRDAVGEATTKLEVDDPWGPSGTDSGNDSDDFDVAAAAARPPTARRWPRLEDLEIPLHAALELTTLEALGAETWGRLRTLYLYNFTEAAMSVPSACALLAALRRMPVLHRLALWNTTLSDAAASSLFRASSIEAVPQLRALTVMNADLSLAAVRMLAVTGWRLEELDLWQNDIGAAGLAALVAAPTFAIRCLALTFIKLDAASLLPLADTPWPLEELSMSSGDCSAAGPALAALSRHVDLHSLHLSDPLSAAGFKALVEASWPALTHLNTFRTKVEFDGPHALGAAAFAGFPALEEPNLSSVELGEAGAQLLARRRWVRLKTLNLSKCGMGDAGLTALARGAWPALEVLDLRDNGFSAPPSLDDARRWAPALQKLICGVADL